MKSGLTERTRGQPRVLIVGAGLAGLAAAWVLRTQSKGAVDVTLLEHRGFAGGKASSQAVHAGAQTFEVEHGLHVFFDYPNFRALLSEIEPAVLRRIRPASGSFFFREVGDPVRVSPFRLPSPLHLLGGHRLARAYGPDSLVMLRIVLSALMFRKEQLSPSELRRLDQLSFDEYAKKQGLSSHRSGTPFFVTPGRATFCYPVPPSALSMLRTIRLVQQNVQAQRCGMLDGSCAEVLIEPLLRGVTRTGAALLLHHRARRLVCDESGVQALAVQPFQPQSAAALAEQAVESPYADSQTPAPSGPELLLDADRVILTAPPEAVLELLDAPLRRHPYFAELASLRTKRTIACQLYFDQDVSKEGPTEMVVGTPDPYSAVFDRARLWSSPDAATPGGSVLVFVGEEDSMPEASDEELVRQAEQLAHAIYPAARKATILRRFFHRSAGDPYFPTPRGSERQRPSAATPITNCWLAGDYTANSFGVVGMEGAVVSGIEAANGVLRTLGYPERTVLPMAAPGGAIPLLRWVLKKLGLFARFTGYSEPVHPANA